jgi:hypothetical protein
LPGLLERADPAAIHFFFANFTGMRRKLFPELALAYKGWWENGETSGLSGAAEAGLSRWSGVCDDFIALHARLGEGAGAEIEAWLESVAPSH